MPYALSVHHFISSVGADAGFASLIGLAILVLLYFAQARETTSLRQFAEEASARIAELESRLTQLGRAQAAASVQASGAQAVRPAGNAAGVGAGTVAARGVALAAGPSAPAGVAAPALAAATRLIPVTQAAPARAAAAPATAAGADPAPVSAATAPVSASNGHGSITPPPRLQLRSATMPPAGRRATLPPRAHEERSRSRGWLGVALGTVLVIAVAAALLVVTGAFRGSSAKTATTTSSSTAATTATLKRQPAVTPSSVTVAVLNGTTTTGLAHQVAQQLAGMGYKEGSITTATDQTRTVTVVAYRPGFRRDAVAVAKSMKLDASAVQPVDSASEAVACPPPNPCNANVIVTVGSDLAATH